MGQPMFCHGLCNWYSSRCLESYVIDTPADVGRRSDSYMIDTSADAGRADNVWYIVTQRYGMARDTYV